MAFRERVIRSSVRSGSIGERVFQTSYLRGDAEILMKWAEFEEASYEAPLYNQLERGVAEVYTPGRVLERRLGFDRGILVAEHLVWATLGYSAPPPGIALGYYDWPMFLEPRRSGRTLPRFRLNIFLQAKRPLFHARRPRKLAKFPDYSGALWAFSITPHQQVLLEQLASRAGRRAHVAYAAPVFHTRADLYKHTRLRTVVQQSTFPSALALKDHESWFYRIPGATGIANADPERIEEQPFLDRIRSAKFLDDLQTLDRLMEPFALRRTLRAYAQVRLFSIQFAITWLIHGSPN